MAQIVVTFFNFLTGLCLMVVSFVSTTVPSTSKIELTLRYIFRLSPSFCRATVWRSWLCVHTA
jgi:hypothetical protein